MGVLRPRIFIGSSIEARQAAKQVAETLDWCECEVWTEGFFRPGGATAATIQGRLLDFEGAMFLLSPDDFLKSRGKVGPAARSNVIFELGMFGGALGLSNCLQFILKTDDTSWDTEIDAEQATWL